MVWCPQKSRDVADWKALEPQIRELLEGADSSQLWQLQRSIQEVLVRESGSWTQGWSWGRTDGGPVTSWCCSQHSLLAGPKERETTLQTIRNALAEWTTVLDNSEKLFERLRLEEAIDLDLAALEIVDFALSLTEAEDAWYHFTIQLLSWYLQHQGVEHDFADEAAELAVAGHFHSWTGPSQAQKEIVAESFREQVWKQLSGKVERID